MLQAEAIGFRQRTEKQLVLGYIILACLTMASAIYGGYSVYYAQLFDACPGLAPLGYSKLHNTTPLTAAHPIFFGQDYAPDQYRIGVVFVAKFIADSLHISKYYAVYSGVDFLAGVVACWGLYGLLARSRFLQSLPSRSQSVLIVSFLAMLAYPLAWVAPWARPETVPTALFLILELGLLRRVKRQPSWLLAVFALALWQGIVRADVPVVLGVAVILVSLTSFGRELFGSAKRGLLSGALIAAIAAAIQFAMQRLIYPDAVYPPGTPRMMLFINLKNIRANIEFLIALAPYLALLALAAKYYRRLDSEDILALTVSLLYLPLWYAMGVSIEVRIFVPCLLALTPAAAKLMWTVIDRPMLRLEAAKGST